MNKPAKRPTSVRAKVAEILVRVETGAHADALLDRQTSHSAADTRLLREIVLGTITWQRRLDHYLDRYLKHPIRQQKRPVRSLLRSGAYQILHLDRVPSYAVVSECVDLARKHGKGVAGMVNAVLRGLAENRKPVVLPDPDENPVSHLAITWSHPEWLVERWLARYDFDTTARLCEAGNARPPITLRVNPSRTTIDELAASLSNEGFDTRPVDDLEGFLSVPSAAGLFDTDAFARGWFSIQGPGAARVSRLLHPRPGETVLDVCAAPGGKSTAAAEHADVTVVASDLSPKRLRTVRQNTDRLGLTIPIFAADARTLPLRRLFDHVLVDAPCTGLGTLSRHPEIRWNRSPADLVRMSTLQSQILQSAAQAVKPDGTLIYTTCTTEPEENDQVVENFLSTHPQFRLDDTPESPAILTILPDPFGTDGAFGARLRKQS